MSAEASSGIGAEAAASTAVVEEASFDALGSRASASSVSESSGSRVGTTCSSSCAKSKSRTKGLYSLPERSYASKGKI